MACDKDCTTRCAGACNDNAGDFQFDINDLMVGDWVADNMAMHDKFGVVEAVDQLDEDKLLAFLEFRLKFLEEELTEAHSAFARLKELRAEPEKEVVLSQEGPKLADDIVDAMIDLCVVAIGTLDALQVNPYLAWDRVHAANMAKEVGIKASRPNPLGLPDLVKPEGWTAPSHEDNLGILPRLYGEDNVSDTIERENIRRIAAQFEQAQPITAELLAEMVKTREDAGFSSEAIAEFVAPIEVGKTRTVFVMVHTAEPGTLSIAFWKVMASTLEEVIKRIRDIGTFVETTDTSIFPHVEKLRQPC